MANDDQMHVEEHQGSMDQNRNRTEQNLKISNRPYKIMDKFDRSAISILKTKCVDDNFEIYMYIHPKDVANNTILSPILKNCHQHLCSRTDRSQDLAIAELHPNFTMMVEVRNPWTETKLKKSRTNSDRLVP